MEFTKLIRIFATIMMNTLRSKEHVPLFQEFDSLSKDEKNNILLNLKNQYNKK